MRKWQILAVGLVAAIALWSFPLYQSVIAGFGAIVVVGVAAIGFWLHPRTDLFYVRTAEWRMDADGNLTSEHEQLVVKVEIARLWLLFVPTALAVTFLPVTAARGTLWQIGVFDWVENSYAPLIVNRLTIIYVFGALYIWISERRVLRNADVCSPSSVSLYGGRVAFAFVDRGGARYGGDCLRLGLVRPRALATLVIYAAKKPELNKIGMGLLFHRLIILGRGLTDLDEQTVAAPSAVPETNS